MLKVVTGTSQNKLSVVTVATAKDTLYATPEHPFYLPQLKKYVPASELRQGNHLQLSNGTCTAITSTHWLDTLVTVYNISVAKHHNYFAEGVLVHNNECGSVWDRFADHPNLSRVKSTVKGWNDVKLEKAFLKDTDDNNLAKELFDQPDLLDVWHILSKFSNVRKDNDYLTKVNFFLSQTSTDSRFKRYIKEIITKSTNDSKAKKLIKNELKLASGIDGKSIFGQFNAKHELPQLFELMNQTNDVTAFVKNSEAGIEGFMITGDEITPISLKEYTSKNLRSCAGKIRDNAGKIERYIKGFHGLVGIGVDANSVMFAEFTKFTKAEIDTYLANYALEKGYDVFPDIFKEVYIKDKNGILYQYK
ncbi:intein C-terminal splicing region domain protein [Microscilla marina ATCC 23134]|uniref:Intein C-terminal splicing region domain protein n=1 Tax=Microscilla marina ATCC 23134 TaxID=313606 RepID=A2A0P2_MICM2|nr:intein C-terminal splicing region domain protein [Microscilla marina ATCC 23134]